MSDDKSPLEMEDLDTLSNNVIVCADVMLWCPQSFADVVILADGLTAKVAALSSGDLRLMADWLGGLADRLDSHDETLREKAQSNEQRASDGSVPAPGCWVEERGEKMTTVVEQLRQCAGIDDVLLLNDPGPLSRGWGYRMNHVPDEIIDNWGELPLEAKLVAYILIDNLVLSYDPPE